jgi:16S rRNA (cytidine1402-2'-O)-methyltransferase
MGDCDPMDLPQTVKRTIDFIDYYIVEMKNSSNQSKKYIQKKTIRINFFCFEQTYWSEEHQDFIQPLLEGKILFNDAGCPGVADPGAVIVKLAHEKGIQVVPVDLLLSF